MNIYDEYKKYSKGRLQNIVDNGNKLNKKIQKEIDELKTQRLANQIKISTALRVLKED